MRTSTLERITKESSILIELNIDGSRKIDVNTSVPFLDHLLTLFAFYAGFDLSIKASGDIEVDDHHTVEDIGITLGLALKKALGEKKGITRYASAYTPMDEALSRVVIDISNRPFLVNDASFTRETIGGLSLENIQEFLYAFTINAGITLHVSLLYGDNDHHKAESIFKGIGRVLKESVFVVGDEVTSTKGVL